MKSFLLMIFFILVCNNLIRGSASTIPEKIPQKKDRLDGNISPAVFLLYNGEVKPAGTLGEGCKECKECTHGCLECYDNKTYCCCGSQANYCCSSSCGQGETCTSSSCGVCGGPDSHDNIIAGSDSTTSQIITIVVVVVVIVGVIIASYVSRQYYLGNHQLAFARFGQQPTPVTYQNLHQQVVYPAPTTSTTPQHQQGQGGYPVVAVTYQNVQPQQPQTGTFPTQQQYVQTGYAPVPVVAYPQSGGVQMASTLYHPSPATNPHCVEMTGYTFSESPSNQPTVAGGHYPVQVQQYSHKF